MWKLFFENLWYKWSILDSNGSVRCYDFIIFIKNVICFKATCTFKKKHLDFEILSWFPYKECFYVNIFLLLLCLTVLRPRESLLLENVPYSDEPRKKSWRTFFIHSFVSQKTESFPAVCLTQTNHIFDKATGAIITARPEVGFIFREHVYAFSLTTHFILTWDYFLIRNSSIH